MGLCESIPIRIAPAHHSAPSDIEFSATRCVVCMMEELNVCLYPCGHLCLCVTCSNRLMDQKCPLCRLPIKSKLRVYVPKHRRYIREERKHDSQDLARTI